MQGRQPFLLGIIGAVIGIVLAVVVFGGNGQPGASGAPTLPGPSSSPAPSQVAVGSVPPSAEVTIGPPSSAPTDAPTSAPTPRPTKTPKPTPTPNTNPAIVSWDTPKYEDCTADPPAAGMISVSWSVKRAEGVTISIDGGGIFDSYDTLVRENLVIPYGCDLTVLKHTYTLTTVGGTGPAATVTKTVRTRPPSVESFVLTPVTGCAGTSGNATVRLSYTVRAATGASLYTDGAIYANYSGKEAGPIPIPYDCSKSSITFKLKTTGGYGPSASKTIVLDRPTEP